MRRKRKMGRKNKAVEEEEGRKRKMIGRRKVGRRIKKKIRRWWE